MNGTRCVAFACVFAISTLANAQSEATGYGWLDADTGYYRSDHGGTGFKYLEAAGSRLGWKWMERWRSFSYGAMYAPGEKSSATWSAGVRYADGPFSASLAYTRLRHPAGIAALYPYPAVGISAFLGQTVAVVDPLTGAVTDRYAAGVFGAGSQPVLTIGVQWKIGSISLVGNAASTTFNGVGRPSVMRAIEIGGTAQLSPVWLSAVGYQHASFEDSGWHQLTAGVAYSLSNWAAVYLSGDYLQSSGNGRGGMGYGAGPWSMSRQADIRMGMQMKF